MINTRSVNVSGIENLIEGVMDDTQSSEEVILRKAMEIGLRQLRNQNETIRLNQASSAVTLEEMDMLLSAMSTRK